MNLEVTTGKIFPSFYKKPPKLRRIMTEITELITKINIKYLQGLFELQILEIGKELDININIFTQKMPNNNCKKSRCFESFHM